MKLKSWMEAHIVLHTKWKKKDKRKKSSEKSKNQTIRDTSSTTLPSWRTSNFLQFFVAGNASATKHSKTLPELREKDCKSSFIPEDIAPSNVNTNIPTPKCGNEGASIHVLHVHLADQLDGGSLNSPRQRNKIRTNPWLTPKQQQRSLPSSGASSDCNSVSLDPRRSSYLSSSTTESSRNSYPSGSDLESANGDPVVVQCPQSLPPEPARKPSKSFPGHDSDSEECETLNEMGNFDEHYEYDWETAESDILGDEPDGLRHRLSKRRGRRLQIQVAAPPQLKWRDLRSDEDYSERLDYADEAYSEMSSSSTEGRGGGFSDGDDKVGDVRSPEVDSAFPSESEMSSSATTPLMEGTGAGSSSGSDSGIQPHSGWSESGRTLRGIRDSLEDKVRNLRFERLIVEDRIREAKEEEEQRRAEKERFRKELVSHRRLVLLRTLDELRLKLEDHSARLQEAYHSTLEMQLSCRQQLATVVEENLTTTAARMPMTHEKLL